MSISDRTESGRRLRRARYALGRAAEERIREEDVRRDVDDVLTGTYHLRPRYDWLSGKRVH